VILREREAFSPHSPFFSPIPQNLWSILENDRKNLFAVEVNEECWKVIKQTKRVPNNEASRLKNPVKSRVFGISNPS